jgi:hypothetical protein
VNINLQTNVNDNFESQNRVRYLLLKNSVLLATFMQTNSIKHVIPEHDFSYNELYYRLLNELT